MEELEKLINEPALLVVRGETLEITPITVRQVPAFAKAIKPVLGALGGRELSAATVLDLMGDQGDALIQAVGIATGKPLEWFDGLALDDFLALAVRVIEVNAYFFAQRVAPALMTALSRLPGSTPLSA